MALMLSPQTGALLRPSLFAYGRRYATAPLLSLRLPIKPQASSVAHHAAPKPSISPISKAPSPPGPAFAGPTWTATTLFALAFAVSRVLLLRGLSLAVLPVPAPAGVSLSAAGTLFFAAARGGTGAFVNSPMGVVAAGVAKWLDLYSAVLMIRVLLSWFPNIPWERQPMTAIRDLCDPYLNLFRNILPPIFDTLDVSPILAFGVLGLLGMILAGT